MAVTVQRSSSLFGSLCAKLGTDKRDNESVDQTGDKENIGKVVDTGLPDGRLTKAEDFDANKKENNDGLTKRYTKEKISMYR